MPNLEIKRLLTLVTVAEWDMYVMLNLILKMVELNL